MTCSDFLSRFSDFYDGEVDSPGRKAFEKHLERCRACQRYTRVVREGGELFRSLPAPELRHDFHPRLQHRIFHLDDDHVHRSTMGSGTTAATVLAMAVIVVLAAWYPTLQPEDPTVEMPAIVVSEPPNTVVPGFVPPEWLRETRDRAPFYEHGLWRESHQLLYEHSPLSERRGSSVLRAGLH